MPSPSPIVVRDLSVSFDGRPVLDGVDLTVPPGHRVGLVGENGSGKSTLLACVAGALLPGRRHGRGPRRPRVPAPGRWSRPPGHRRAGAARGARPVARDDARGGAARRPGGTASRRCLRRSPVRRGAGGGHRPRRLGRRPRTELAAQRLGVERLPREPAGGRAVRRAALPARPGRAAGAAARGAAPRRADQPPRRPAAEFLEAQLRDLGGRGARRDARPGAARRGRAPVRRPRPAAPRGRRAGWGDLDRLVHRVPRGERGRRRRWEEDHARQSDELADLREAAGRGTAGVAHGRGPRDNDKFVHAFKGARVPTAAARRSRDAEQRIARILRDPVPDRLRPRFSGGLGRVDSAGSTRRRQRAVRGLSCPVGSLLTVSTWAPGEHLLVTGSNGSGKSTLLRVLAGRDPDTGSLGHRLGGAARPGHDLPGCRPLPAGVASATLGLVEEDARGALLPLGLLPPDLRGAPGGCAERRPAASVGTGTRGARRPGGAAARRADQPSLAAARRRAPRRRSGRAPRPWSSPVTTAGCGAAAGVGVRCTWRPRPESRVAGDSLSRTRPQGGDGGCGRWVEVQQTAGSLSSLAVQPNAVLALTRGRRPVSGCREGSGYRTTQGVWVLAVR